MVVFDLYLICEGNNLGSCDVVIKVSGVFSLFFFYFSTSRLHTVHIVLSDNGCDKCICSLPESSNVISVVREAQWKNPIYEKKKGVFKKKQKKARKVMFAINILEKCLALVFLQDCLCFMVKKYIYWPAVCLNLVPS